VSTTPNLDRLAELHAACREDYAKGSAQRLRATSAPAPQVGAPDPRELATALHVARKMLAVYGDSSGFDIFAYAQAHGGLTEALRIVLRALDTEPDAEQGAELLPPPSGEQRCPAAHPEDPDPCSGPVVVTVLDTHQVGANGCEHHAARLLASLDGGRVYSLPDAPDGAAIRVFKASGGILPFPWVGGPRTRDAQLSRDEVRGRGERP